MYYKGVHDGYEFHWRHRYEPPSLRLVRSEYSYIPLLLQLHTDTGIVVKRQHVETDFGWEEISLDFS